MSTARDDAEALIEDLILCAANDEHGQRLPEVREALRARLAEADELRDILRKLIASPFLNYTEIKGDEYTAAALSEAQALVFGRRADGRLRAAPEAT